jgi:hypothetical protein
MVKKAKYKTGDLFSIKVAENEYIFGRILFDPNEQYLKKIPKEQQFSCLDFFGKCVLIETFTGVFSSSNEIDYNKIAVKSSFVSNKIFIREDVEILDNKKINPVDVSFPEIISSFNSNYYFSVGELKIPINITTKERDDIHVYPSYGSGYWEMVATLVYSKREDLVEEKNHIHDNYFTSEDLRSKPDIRRKIYKMISEDPNQSYYEMALRHGFDLARLY